MTEAEDRMVYAGSTHKHVKVEERLNALENRIVDLVNQVSELQQLVDQLERERGW